MTNEQTTYKLNLDVPMLDHYDRPLLEDYAVGKDEVVTREIQVRNVLLNLMYDYKSSQMNTMMLEQRREISEMFFNQIKWLREGKTDYTFDEVLDLVRFIDQLNISAYLMAQLYHAIPAEYFAREEDIKKEEELKRTGAAREREQAQEGMPVDAEDNE